MTKLTDHQIIPVELYLYNTFYMMVLMLRYRGITQKMFSDWSFSGYEQQP